jgi:peptidoglycan hydrolase-like protein with peptidoglycan-binding domain
MVVNNCSTICHASLKRIKAGREPTPRLPHANLDDFHTLNEKEITTMATREMVHFKHVSSPIEQANVSHIVGIGGENEKMDVMLIQALFRLVGYDDDEARKMIGLGVADLPEPTGIFDEKTSQAIWSYQRRRAHKLLNVDGKIHSGNYHQRVIKDLHGRLMTITRLNIDADIGAAINHNTKVVPALTLVAPQLVLTPVAP